MWFKINYVDADLYTWQFDYSGLGSGRLYSAAPGAETHKYRAGSLSNGLFGGNSLFPSKMVARRYEKRLFIMGTFLKIIRKGMEI